MSGGKNTSEECMRGAFDALLRGDLDERDRLCARADTLMAAEAKANAVERVLSVDFYAGADGVVISTKVMARASGAIQ